MTTRQNPYHRIYINAVVTFIDTACKIWPLAIFDEWCGALVFNAEEAEADYRKIGELRTMTRHSPCNYLKTYALVAKVMRVQVVAYARQDRGTEQIQYHVPLRRNRRHTRPLRMRLPESLDGRHRDFG